jgi:uncharacterized YigZ family protein
MQDGFQTLAGEVRCETDKVKGSRFLALAAPVGDAAAASAVLEAVRGEFPAATHHCFAYRLAARGGATRCHDDGEPAGSAGRPILQQIEARGLHEALVVVVRYFGGTKLGVGGLRRAYGGAARQVLELAPVREVVYSTLFSLRYPYECSRPVEALLRVHGGALDSSSYAERVEAVVRIPAARAAAFVRDLTESTSGVAEIISLED